MAFGQNVTKCIGRREPCIGRSDCCYECDYTRWCPVRCRDNACHLDQVRERLHIVAEKKRWPTAIEP